MANKTNGTYIFWVDESVGMSSATMILIFHLSQEDHQVVLVSTFSRSRIIHELHSSNYNISGHTRARIHFGNKNEPG